MYNEEAFQLQYNGYFYGGFNFAVRFKTAN